MVGKYMKILIQRTLAFFLVLLLFTAVSGSAKDVQEFDRQKNELIGYMLDKELPAEHFSHKKMNESLARAAFDLYLKQVDYQKKVSAEQ
jgi:carboxyl-terminal processing protease